ISATSAFCQSSSGKLVPVFRLQLNFFDNAGAKVVRNRSDRCQPKRFPSEGYANLWQPQLAIQNRKRAESCMLRGGRTDVIAPKPVGFPVSEARLVGVGSMRPVDATNPRTLSVELTVSYCV